MTSIDLLIQSVRHSPQLPQILAVLQREWENERQRRLRFYDEMTLSQKVEFINREVVEQANLRQVAEFLQATATD